MPVHIFGGAGCFREQIDLVCSLGKRCLLMVGSTSAQKSGALNEVLSLLEEHRVDVTIYSGVLPDPPVSQCREAALAAQVCRAQFIVALGGGSVIDAAKAAACLAANSAADTAALFKGELRCPALPLVAIGTTAGTGSEVTRVGVLTRDETGRKQSFRHNTCYPRYAFADPRYTATMPRGVTISTALDALCHAVEGWFSPRADEASRLWARQAITVLMRELEWLMQNKNELPDLAGRERLLYASLWAGMALNAAGVGFPHTMGYVLTEDHGIPHGRACAAFLPAFLERAETVCLAEAERLYAVCGGKEMLFNLVKQAADVTITFTEEQIQSYVARWTIPPANFENTPGRFTAAEAETVLRHITSEP